MHVERTGNPLVMRWVCHDPRLGEPGERRVSPDSPANCGLAALLVSEQIVSVSIIAGDLLVHVADIDMWQSVAPLVNSAVAADLGSETIPIWLTQPTATEGSGHQPSVAQAQHVVDHAAGAIASSHGGRIEVIGVVVDGISVMMHGACHGCSGANVTLTDVVQRAIQNQWPQLVRVSVVEQESKLTLLQKVSIGRRTSPSTGH
jgi:NFU1 iron-sulfur cluster scaffold homolog, mitochondrial